MKKPLVKKSSAFPTITVGKAEDWLYGRIGKLIMLIKRVFFTKVLKQRFTFYIKDNVFLMIKWYLY
jgi:hypothetical protein